ncbi:2-C-methyl-D-erythritol 4-phosphate cytidylyltransferase/2-C-methyl-D-erythritol 4-phosphate cytidylyltransferase / 2-C-methyl-D-erythritol 2,4-cyclodiphosphate synthase [Pseudorhodobacter antarcticus]|jgi:2-C-methyl-D-erythritol 4-phosphate cytidylyltransferase|uniref:2-C-methyl-D-erythritol 4-phosphate cytidylyltransferase n=1 Tax=Pseudorhodobacter antarcticus TaxID=1077947 RepID=A0A1H8JV40_9RHOB|nr:2-C-methyl-D-erythritol 4-phosphate cytidylyltransferase [Pseudorhodobacter antarcticus]SEN84078.1 2-C-methyl-D-erythritol 4-phosphate cytidylyltransferase/2-C-methyl-D-erythritol 4-phosphate cytidylyltransferase / 2-C-methyl-D-erythritol 2,4-cyclodiphosphate synthase [Pseudorhodobacter antarcticus]
MTSAVIITAAGRGLRAGGKIPKQWQHLGGKPVLAHTVAAFQTLGFTQILVTIHPDDTPHAAYLGPDVRLIIGGDTRAKSVKNALESIDINHISQVFIHDGARPFVTAALIARLQTALQTQPAAAPALPVTDALWRGENGLVTGVAERTNLFRAQTPQAFHLAAILAAHRIHPGNAADDVEVARAAGLAVAIVAGDEDNIKITLPGDMARAEQILQHRKQA